MWYQVHLAKRGIEITLIKWLFKQFIYRYINEILSISRFPKESRCIEIRPNISVTRSIFSKRTAFVKCARRLLLNSPLGRDRNMCSCMEYITISERKRHLTEASDKNAVGPSWSWSYRSWIYNYLCNQWLSPLTLCVRITLRRGVLDTTLCDKVCQWLAAVPWFSLGTPVGLINWTDHHDITEILL